MKKAITILLACLLLFSLVACKDKSANDNAPANNAPTDSTPAVNEPSGNGGGNSGKASPWANADGSANLDKVGYYDPDFDYTQNTKYRVIYVRQDSPDPNTEPMANALNHWAQLMNIQFDGTVTANGDPDLFLTLIQTQIDQGYNGLIIDPEAMIAISVMEIMDANPQVAWMPFLNPARDYDSAHPDDPGRLLHPFLGFDFIYNGQQSAKGLLDWKENNYPDVAWDRVGYVVIRNAEIGVFNLLQAGSQEIIRASAIPAGNQYVADVASFGGGTSPDVAQQAIASVLSTHDCDVWLIDALIEPYGLGSGVATTTLGITDHAAIITTSANALIQQWESGVVTSWCVAWYTAEIMLAEPIMGAVAAFLNGWATPETIWPQWVNVNDSGAPDGPYALVIMPAIYMTQDNYAQYLAWTDVYSDSNQYPQFSRDGITRDTFPSTVPVPDFYKVPN